MWYIDFGNVKYDKDFVVSLDVDGKGCINVLVENILKEVLLERLNIKVLSLVNSINTSCRK